MPHGHAPDALFGAAHFDVHFYLVTEAERLAVDPADPHFMDKAAHEPDRALMPADFVPPRGRRWHRPPSAGQRYFSST